VLSEEALVLVTAVGACALLILGILELVWPSRPRHPVRRLEPAPPPAKPAPVAAPKTPAARGRASKASDKAPARGGRKPKEKK